MASLEQRHWPGEVVGLARRDRRPCAYEVYLPDLLSGRRFSLEGDVAAEVTRAETALARLDTTGNALANSEALARLLLRAESVASSRIEGLEVGGRRLLRADAAQRLGVEPLDVTSREVLGNIAAMTWALNSVGHGDDVTLDGLLETHRRLLAGTRLEDHGGKVRTAQNWIGGSDYNPCSASFVPPPPEDVPRLMADLIAFCNNDSLPVLAHAAVAHAQFETIHPFVDGNGRAGRALIHMVMRRRGLGLRILAPISLILATWSQDYIDGLNGTRYVGHPDSSEAHAGVNSWISLFASACSRSVDAAARFENRVRELQSDWRERVGRIRRDSAVSLLIDALPAAPVLTTSTAAELVGRSFQATSLAVDRLVGAGALVQVNIGRRNRAFEAHELVDEFTMFERRLASPQGDTRVSAPARRAPRRPR